MVSKGIITLEDAAKIKQDAKKQGVSFEDALYRHGVSEKDVADAKGELTGYPVKSLMGQRVPFEVLKNIPEESARHYRMIPLRKAEGYLEVGMLNPEDVVSQEALKFLGSRLGMPIKIFVITPSDFETVLDQYRSLSGEVTKALSEFEKELERMGSVKVGEGREVEHPSIIVEEAPITKMVGVIIQHAVEGRASDIHIEPGRKDTRVRFRVDGVLHTSLNLPKHVHNALVTRIKVMTNLKIDETRIPQDGRFNTAIGERSIDFRVSTFPTSFGEKVVIRILDPAGGITSLQELGLTGRNLYLAEENIKRPYGLILITGPTGSGKSTTLYAMLRSLNREGVNIVSLEDPIEYYIEGISQSQVRPEIGYTFATGIRHILRQDPDIIMVGEIRDKETAALAVHAALTGHLVLATLHTNNAIGVIPRLIDMGVDPFLIAPTLVLAIAQRLVRTLCPDSKKKVKLSGKIKEVIAKEISAMPQKVREEVESNMPEAIYKSEVSPLCPKGTRGRTGIFEVLAMTPQLEKIILSSPSEAKIQTEATRQEMLTMRQDGILKVLKGEIGLEELLEVVV